MSYRLQDLSRELYFILFRIFLAIYAISSAGSFSAFMSSSLLDFSHCFRHRLWDLSNFYVVAERTLYFCLAHELIWPLWLSHIFTQWGCPGQHKNGESPPNSLFLRIFRARQTYFLSSLFMAAESLDNEESHLIYEPLSLPSKTKGSQLNMN